MPSPFAARFWGGHVVMVVLLAAAVLLGWWQISVYESHRAAAAIDRTRDPTVALTTSLGPDQAFPSDAVGRPVTVDGTWLSQDTVLVSGQEQGGRDGYWLVTPVKVTATGSSIPVVLGWTADPATAPQPPSGPAQVSAWLQPSQGDDGPTTSAPPADAAYDVLPSLRTATMLQNVDGDLYDGYAVAQTGTDGLVRADLPKPPDAGFWTSLRNLLYGIQWWVFGGFAVVMWWRWLADARSDERDEAHADQAARDDADPVSTVKA